MGMQTKDCLIFFSIHSLFYMMFKFSFLKYDITNEKLSENRWHFNTLLAHTNYKLEEGSGQKLDLKRTAGIQACLKNDKQISRGDYGGQNVYCNSIDIAGSALAILLLLWTTIAILL